MSAAAAKQKHDDNIRVVAPPYFADVVVDRRTHPPTYHWIAQREGSPDIVYWGQAESLDEAKEAAQASIDERAKRERAG